MPTERGKTASPRSAGSSAGPRLGRPAKVDLPREIVEELRQMVRGEKADEAISYLSRATVLLARGDAGAATKEAEKARVFAPRSSAVREVLGLAYYGCEKFKEALAELQAYRRMSDRTDQNHIIADCYRALGQPEKAVAPVEEELRAKVPQEAKAEATVVGAAALADMGKFDQALAMLRRFTQRRDVGADYDLRVWYVTGDVLARAGRREEAASEFRKVVRHDSAAFDAAERLSELS